MKVNLQKIVDELQMRFIDNTPYYNKTTGEVLNVNDDDLLQNFTRRHFNIWIIIS